jgi:hypothetical protein
MAHMQRSLSFLLINRWTASEGDGVMNSSSLLLSGGVLLIAVGILSTFQVSGEYVLMLLVAFGGAGLFLVTWSGLRRGRPSRHR